MVLQLLGLLGSLIIIVLSSGFLWSTRAKRGFVYLGLGMLLMFYWLGRLNGLSF